MRYRKLVTLFVIALMSFQVTICVYASDGTKVQVETTGGKQEDVEVDVSVESVGNQQITTTKAKEFVTSSGMVVDYDAKSVIETKEGSKLTNGFIKYLSISGNKMYIASGGYEIESQINIPTLKIELPLQEGITRTVLGKGVGVINSEGSLTGGTYDYKKVSITNQAKGIAKTSSIECKEVVGNNTNELEHVYSSTTVDNGGLDIMYPKDKVQLPTSKEEIPTIKEGFEYAYLGIGTLSHYWAALLYDHSDPSIIEEPVYTDVNGNSYYAQASHKTLRNRDLALSGIYLNGEYIAAPSVEEGISPKTTYFPAKYDSVQQFYLVDKEGNLATTYCADITTKAIDDVSYVVRNMDEADYYDTSSANMIRTVAWNGYWGAESGFGSMSAFKQQLKDSGQFSDEELAKLTDGIAMTATQYAIWNFSNKMDGTVFLNAYYRPIATGYPGKGNVTTANKEASDILFKVYEYLTKLEPITFTKKTTQNTMINETNFIDKVIVEIIDKETDAYKGNVSFTLKTEVNTEKGDDLVVVMYDQGKEIARGRIAGQLQENESYLTMNNGEYTFTNVMVTEGAHELSFEILGKQYMEKGVYLYTSEIVNDIQSQTMVGIASGLRNVNVEMNINFELEVKDEVVTTERMYRTEKNVETIKTTIDGIKYLDDKAKGGYTFVLSNGQEVVKEVVSKEDGTFAFDEIEFVEPGVFVYTVTEKVGSNGVEYDQSVYEITYTVEVNTDTLEIVESKIKKGDVVVDKIVFENTTKTVVPPTGDANMTILYASIAMIVSGIGIFVFRYLKK